MKYILLIIVILAIVSVNLITNKEFVETFDNGTSNIPLGIQGQPPGQTEVTDTSFNIIAANQVINQSPMTPAHDSSILSFGQVPIPQSGIPDGYYQTGTHYMTSIPFGYVASSDKQTILPQVQSTITDISSNNPSLITTNASNRFTTDSSNNITRYDPNNYDITFHANPQDNSSNYFSEIDSKLPGATYYQPGTYPYGPTSWVPNYEESVYLSKLTGYSANAPLYNTASQKSGFCVHYANDPQGLEEHCNKLDQNVCASTSCCVLLGSSKCVSGNENGPIMKSNYSDVFIANREYYYYNGRCFGRCLD